MRLTMFEKLPPLGLSGTIVGLNGPDEVRNLSSMATKPSVSFILVEHTDMVQQEFFGTAGLNDPDEVRNSASTAISSGRPYSCKAY